MIIGAVDSLGSPISIFQLWPLFFVSLAGGAVGTFVCRRLAIRLGIVDMPDGLVKTHARPIAYLGGVGMLIGFAVGIFTAMLWLSGRGDYGVAVKWLAGILAAGFIACLTGAVDDVSDIRPWQKVVGQVLAGGALFLAGIRPELNVLIEPTGFELPFVVDRIAGFAFLLVFVLGATNSLNLLDGLDGLCAGVTAVIAFGMLGLGVLASEQSAGAVGEGLLVIVSFILLGSVLGFLPFNYNPASIFMGDAGSLFLGVSMAGVMVMFLQVGLVWCIASIVIFGLPILDTAVAFLRRGINKRPLFVSDRGHIYDQMIDRGLPLRKTVKLCYVIAAGYALAGILISQLTIVYALIGAAGVFAVSGLVVLRNGFLKMEGLRGAVQQED